MMKRILLIVSILVLMLLSCTLTNKSTGNGPTQTGGSPTQSNGSSPTQEPTSPPDPVPVAINEGLTSLNSYEMAVQINSSNPDPTKNNVTEIHRQHASNPDSSLTQIIISGTDEDGAPKRTETNLYQIGNDQCSGSEAEGWDWNSSNPVEAEMAGLTTSMIGLSPLIDDPVFVAAETINGILSNHFTFKVSGLGASSGAVVKTNQGDYWLASDGQYIVKYVLVVEESTAADAPSYRTEVSIEMTQVNQPVSIAFPAGCTSATPEP